MKTIVVVEDLTHARNSTLLLLQNEYPQANIIDKGSANEALKVLGEAKPDLLVVDLGLPEEPGDRILLSNGIQILRFCMKKYPALNITVQTADPKALIRLKQLIDSHQGGFTVVDKALPLKEMIRRVSWAMEGIVHTRDIRGWQSGIEMKREWLETLRLASQQESLQDKAIAERLQVTEATVRHYWKKIQDVLEVYPELYKVKKNLRVMTLERAREERLID